MLPNISEYLGQVLDIFIFQILYFRLPKLPSLFSLLTTFGHFGAYGHFFIERIIAKAFGDSLKTIMGIYQLYTGMFVHYHIWLFGGRGASSERVQILMKWIIHEGTMLPSRWRGWHSRQRKNTFKNMEFKHSITFL